MSVEQQTAEIKMGVLCETTRSYRISAKANSKVLSGIHKSTPAYYTGPSQSEDPRIDAYCTCLVKPIQSYLFINRLTLRLGEFGRQSIPCIYHHVSKTLVLTLGLPLCSYTLIHVLYPWQIVQSHWHQFAGNDSTLLKHFSILNV